MNVVQVMPTVSFGDAVSNDARALARVISEMGHKTGIYAENIDIRVSGDPFVHKLSRLPSLSDGDVVIFNHSTGTELCYKLPKLRGRKMMIYHNITPPGFFDNFSVTARDLTRYGYEGTRYLSDKIEYVMADSAFNVSELRRMGYTCRADVRPILIPFGDYTKAPDAKVLDKYGDGCRNILFVGRIAPNKKQEDIISAFAYYKKHVDPRSRLILAGSYSGMERYFRALKDYASALMPDGVVFTGHTDFSELLAYYKLADVFLCMSEHEGFCVPLVEAMLFGVPIIAYDSCAVSETLGGSGVLIKDKDPVFVSMLIDRIMKDGELREYIIREESKRLRYFDYNRTRETFESQLRSFIEG